MKVRNKSFVPLVAVLSDTRTELPIMPQETVEVPDIEVPRMLERYPEMVEIVPSEVEPVKVNEIDEDAPEAVEVEQDSLICPVCGKECASKVGLMAHERSHK